MSESERSGAYSDGFNPSESSDNAAELEQLRREAAVLRQQLADVRARSEGAEDGGSNAREIHQLEARIDSLAARNAKLMDTLKEARQQLLALREEVDRLGQPPSGYGVLLGSTCSPRGARCA
jgi:proteasome-associated ATPase